MYVLEVTLPSATVTATPAGGKGDASTRRGSYGPTRLTGKTVLGRRCLQGDGWMEGEREREGTGGEGEEGRDWGEAWIERFMIGELVVLRF